MIVRPKLFLDTQICIHAAGGSIPANEWARVRKYIGAKYRYCISFVTMKELFCKLARCDDKFFDTNKESLRILYGHGNRCFLPYPHSFAIRTVLGYPVSRKSETVEMTEEVWAETITKAVLRAPSKVLLKEGIAIPNRKRVLQTFDLDHFDNHEDGAQKEHADLLQQMREGRIEKPEPMKWAEWILYPYELTPCREDCEKLVTSLDAAYRYGVRLSTFTRNKNYNFRKKGNISAWGDIAQLFYLCDEKIHFLTMDKNFHEYTKGSPQASRVLVYENFLHSLPS